MALYLTQNETEKCVMARINRQNQRYQANFSLAKYGTWEKANRAARKWVREILPTLPDPIPVKDRKTKRNTSGVVGVRLANATRTRNERVYADWRWTAFWPDCPFSGGIGWSVNKYGDEQAFVFAYLARKAESVDREKIEKSYAKLLGTKRLASIVALKQSAAPSAKPAAKVTTKAKPIAKAAIKVATKAKVLAKVVTKSVAKPAPKVVASSKIKRKA